MWPISKLKKKKICLEKQRIIIKKHLCIDSYLYLQSVFNRIQLSVFSLPCWPTHMRGSKWFLWRVRICLGVFFALKNFSSRKLDSCPTWFLSKWRIVPVLEHVCGLALLHENKPEVPKQWILLIQIISSSELKLLNYFFRKWVFFDIPITFISLL